MELAVQEQLCIHRKIKDGLRIISKPNKLKIARFQTWDLMSQNCSDQETITQLTHHRINLCAILKRKKKRKEMFQIGNSETGKTNKAGGAVDFMVHRKYKGDSIEAVSYTHLDVYKRQVYLCVSRFFLWKTITVANSNRIK